jgi:hypothetical protein
MSKRQKMDLFDEVTANMNAMREFLSSFNRRKPNGKLGKCFPGIAGSDPGCAAKLVCEPAGSTRDFRHVSYPSNNGRSMITHET